MTTSCRRVAPCVLLALLGVVAPTAAQAPPAEGLLLGPVTFKPSVELHDAGIDSNVFNESGDGRADQTAILTGGTEAKLSVGSVQIAGTANADYQYFQTYTRERALNRFFSLRVQPQLNRIRPFIGGAYRRTRDRASNEIDLRAPRTEREASAGIEAQLTSRAYLQGSVRRGYWKFDEGEAFRGVDLATRLNRRVDVAQVGVRYELSPLTTFTVEGGMTRDHFIESPDRDTDTWQTNAGFLFAPDAVIRGRAVVGFRDLRGNGPATVPSRGATAAIDLSYTLLDRTVFAGRFVRETAVSFDAQPYYLSTLASAEVTHNLIGPVDLVGRIGRERLDYDEVPAVGLLARLEHVDTYGGGVAVRVGLRTRVSARYEEHRRRSETFEDRNYDRRRLYTTISYGF